VGVGNGRKVAGTAVATLRAAAVGLLSLRAGSLAPASPAQAEAAMNIIVIGIQCMALMFANHLTNG
jgi:hypothetical protein